MGGTESSIAPWLLLSGKRAWDWSTRGWFSQRSGLAARPLAMPFSEQPITVLGWPLAHGFQGLEAHGRQGRQQSAGAAHRQREQQTRQQDIGVHHQLED